METRGYGPSLPGRSPLVQVTRKKNSGEEGTTPPRRRVKIRRQCSRAGEAPAITEGNSVAQPPRHGGRSPGGTYLETLTSTREGEADVIWKGAISRLLHLLCHRKCPSEESTTPSAAAPY